MPIKVKKESSSDDNVITPEEFQELEKKEGRKIKTKKEEPEEKAPKGGAHDKATDIDMLLLKVEKIEGRLEASADSRKALEERISGLNQEIGELRSSIMEKDKLLRDFQKGFSKIEETAQSMEPERVTKQFSQLEASVEKNQAELEKLALIIEQTRKGMKENKGVLENVRDVKSLMKILKNLKESLAKVEEDRKFTSRTAGKIEGMFTDMSGKIAEFQSYKDKIAFNEETMHEIMKTMDLLETKLDSLVKKDDFKKLESAVDEKLDKLGTDVDDKVFEAKKLLNDLLTVLKEAGVKSVLEKVGKTNVERMFATKGEVDYLRRGLEELRKATSMTAKEKVREFAAASSKAREGVSSEPLGEVPRARVDGSAEELRKGSRPIESSQEQRTIPPAPAKESPVVGIKDRIDSIINQAEESIKRDNLDTAKGFYRRALSMYNQLNQAESTEEAMDVYDRIKRLYSRLRIYS